MKLELDRNGALRLEASGFSLTALRPVINGTPLDGSWEQEPAGTDVGRFRFSLPDGASMSLSWLRAGDRFSMQYRLHGFDSRTPLRSFGLLAQPGPSIRALLRNGYFSWDGSYYVRPSEDVASTPVRGYGMTQLLADDSSRALTLGFDRHDRFQQTFTFGERASTLSIETLWDEKNHPPGAPCEGEQLHVIPSSRAEDGLRAWAHIVAASAPKRPRSSADRIRGWCSWYNLYAAITEQNILDHLRGAQQIAQREKLPLRVFQIDDGFTPEMGDWLDVKPQFPRGMKPLLDDIRSAGFVPGLWIAPFMVGNRSRLYREHPDWVVRDRDSGGPLAHMRFYGEFRWHKRSEEYYILDTTHPAALAWLADVFRTWRHEWGCEYFKTDFMHFGSEYGPERALWHTPGMTRIEVWRRTAEVIREAIGDAVWLGCGCPLWASVGLVDGVRIGRDIGFEWKGDYSAQSLLRDQATRNFAHGILWQADPDCVLLRERFHHLLDHEVQSLALYAGMTGGVAMTSDALDELSPPRVALWKMILGFGPAACRFPMLGNSAPNGELDPVTVQIRPGEREGETIVFVLNPSGVTQQRTYSMSDLGLPSPTQVVRWPATSDSMAPHSQLSLTLDPHDGALFFCRPPQLSSLP